jgi:hypothetical protein
MRSRDEGGAARSDHTAFGIASPGRDHSLVPGLPDSGSAFGYYAAVLKGTDIDQPRYFGESVTDAAQHLLRNRISAVKPFFFLCLMSQVDPIGPFDSRTSNDRCQNGSIGVAFARRYPASAWSRKVGEGPANRQLCRFFSPPSWHVWLQAMQVLTSNVSEIAKRAIFPCDTRDRDSGSNEVTRWYADAVSSIVADRPVIRRISRPSQAITLSSGCAAALLTRCTEKRSGEFCTQRLTIQGRSAGLGKTASMARWEFRANLRRAPPRFGRRSRRRPPITTGRNCRNAWPSSQAVSRSSGSAAAPRSR